MLPGKVYKPEDILQILRKRLWLVVMPFALISATTAAVARKLPDRYVSQVLIQVVPPKVPDTIVRSAGRIDLNQRLQAIQQGILSRTRLERLIQDFNLYADERKTTIMQDVVERMRNDIVVESAKGDAFAVRFFGRNPSTVQKVAERLGSYFIDESQKESQDRAENTSSLIETQAADAKRKLQETEKKLLDYRMRHAGELPEQLGSNQQAIQTTQGLLQQLSQSITNDVNTRLLLERQIEALESPGEAGSAATSATDGGGSAAQRLEAERQVLAGYQSRGMTPEHPDYKKSVAKIARLTKEADAESLKNPVALGAAATPAELQRRRQLAGLKTQVEQLKKEIEGKQAQEKQLRTQATTYQAKIDRVPLREAELVDLTREYDTLRQIHNDYVAKREASSMAVNLERRQIGEQFNLLDQARFPEKPFSPNRILINIFGLLGGFAVGLGLVALVEYRDHGFKTDSELQSVLALPVLAVVPLMLSVHEQKVTFKRQLLLNIGLGATVGVCLAVLTYTFVR